MERKVMRLFGLREMCSNCPWRKDGAAIELAPGRLRSICDNLWKDDMAPFICHKTSNGSSEDGEGYTPDGRERYCVGAMAYLQRVGAPNMAMRLGHALRLINGPAIERAIPLLKDERDIA